MKVGYWIIGMLLIVLMGLQLAGCASMPDVVEVPVVKSCIFGDVVDKRAFPDTKKALLAAENIQERVDLLIAGRILRDGRIDNLEAALAGCL